MELLTTYLSEFLTVSNSVTPINQGLTDALVDEKHKIFSKPVLKFIKTKPGIFKTVDRNLPQDKERVLLLSLV